MNKPAPITPGDHDDAIGPVDADGQQILSPEEEAMFARLEQSPEYLALVERGLDDIRNGRMIDHDEHLAHRAEQRRVWWADRQS